MNPNMNPEAERYTSASAVGRIHDIDTPLWECPLCPEHTNVPYIERYAHLFIQHRQWFNESYYVGKRNTLISVIPLEERIHL